MKYHLRVNSDLPTTIGDNAKTLMSERGWIPFTDIVSLLLVFLAIAFYCLLGLFYIFTMFP